MLTGDVSFLRQFLVVLHPLVESVVPLTTWIAPSMCSNKPASGKPSLSGSAPSIAQACRSRIDPASH